MGREGLSLYPLPKGETTNSERPFTFMQGTGGNSTDPLGQGCSILKRVEINQGYLFYNKVLKVNCNNFQYFYQKFFACPFS